MYHNPILIPLCVILYVPHCPIIFPPAKLTILEINKFLFVLQFPFCYLVCLVLPDQPFSPTPPVRSSIFAEKSPHCSVIISNPRSIYGKGAVLLLVAIFYDPRQNQEKMVTIKNFSTNAQFGLQTDLWSLWKLMTQKAKTRKAKTGKVKT